MKIRFTGKFGPLTNTLTGESFAHESKEAKQPGYIAYGEVRPRGFEVYVRIEGTDCWCWKNEPIKQFFQDHGLLGYSESNNRRMAELLKNYEYDTETGELTYAPLDILQPVPVDPGDYTKLTYFGKY